MTLRALVVAGLALGLCSTALADDRDDEIFGGADDADERDAEIFGGSDDDPDTERNVAVDDRPRELELVDVDDLEGRLLQADDPLTLGGRMYLRLDYNVFDEGGPEEQPLSSPNLVDLFLDVRPNDRLRAFVQGRLRYTPTLSDCDPTAEDCGLSTFAAFGNQRRTDVALDQLWVNFDVGRTVFVTAGRQRIKWGTGRFWNPTDFLNQQTLDPLAIFDERPGSDLVKAHLPIESLGWNLYAVANLDGATSPEEVGGAARAEVLLGTTELALSAGARKDTPLRLGADVSTAIWLFDVRVEGAVSHDVKAAFYEGDFDLGSGTFPTQVDRSDDWIAQVVAGTEVEIGYSDTDSFFLGAEYFFNDAGYENADLYPWLLANGAFNFFYVGRHYAAAYALLPSPGDWNDWTFTVSGLSNLSDRSVLARGDIRVQALTYLSVNTYASVHTGERGEFRLGFDLPAVPLPGLEEGISVPTQVVDVGVGLTLRL